MNHRSDPEEELDRRTAHRETLRNVTKQLQGLKWRLNVLNGVTADTAGSSNNHHHPNSRAFILRKLKYALRTQYEDCFPLPPPDRCSVLLLFDTNEEAFFEIRLKPKAWPEDWPTRFDCGSAGIDVELYSLAIYMKVLEAFKEEGDGMGVEVPPRALGVVSRSSGGGPRSSVVEENGLRRVIVKSEEEEIVIGDEEEEENTVHANEQVNEQRDQQQQEEMEETEEEVMDDNNMLQEENLAGPPREESGSTANHNNNNRNAFNGSNNNNNNNISGGSSSNNQLPFSNTVKQEPTANSSTLIVSRKRPLESTSSSESLQNHPHSLPPPPSAAPKQSINSSTASQSAQFAIAERFLASAAFQAATQRNDRLNCPLCNRHYEKVTLVDHLNIVHLRRPLLYRCSWPGCRFTNQWRVHAENHVLKVHKDDPVRYVVVPSSTPGAVGQQQQQQSSSLAPSSSSSSSSSSAAQATAAAFVATSPSAAAISTPAATSTSASSISSTDWARTEAFLSSAEYAAAGSSTKLPCPFCRFEFRKTYISDHIYGKHFSLRPYRCTWPDCTTGTSGVAFLSQMQSHVKRAHNQAENTGRYIRRDPVVGPSASTSPSSSSRGVAAAAVNLPPPPRSRAKKVRASRGSRAPAPAASNSARLSSSSSSPAEMTAAADRLYASSAYQSARAHDLLPCPLCPKPITRNDLRDHINTVHLKRRRYHCAWPVDDVGSGGCCTAEAFGYRRNGQDHLRRVHGSTEYERYLQCRD